MCSACDMEEVVGILSVSDSNSGLSLLRFNLQKGVLVVGYDLLQTRVDVTVSFHRESDLVDVGATSALSHASFSSSAHQLNAASFNNPTHQLSTASYDGLVIDGG